MLIIVKSNQSHQHQKDQMPPLYFIITAHLSLISFYLLLLFFLLSIFSLFPNNANSNKFQRY